MPLGPTPRNEGGYTWICRNLNILGHSAKICGPVDSPSMWGEFDVQISVDWGADAFVGNYETFVTHPSLIWQSDTHMTKECYDRRLQESRPYDHVCVAQLDAQRWFARDGIKNPIWLPHATEHNLWVPPLKYDKDWSNFKDAPSVETMAPWLVETVPTWEWVFLGNITPHVGKERNDCLDALMQATEGWAWSNRYYLEDAVRMYWKAKVVFNRSVYGDLNMRTFEALSTRSFLLTDRQQGMDEIGLKDGEHCVIYDSPGDAIEKMLYWTDDARAKKRREIAEEGYRWVLAGHTYWHRAKKMLEILGVDISPKQ